MICFFHDTGRCAPDMHAGRHNDRGRWLGAGLAGTDDGTPQAPMLLLGDIDGDGLGCISWWESRDDDEEAEMEE